MQKFILSVFLALLLIPFSQAFSAGSTDTPSTLSVFLKNETPFVYQDSEGYTVVVGVVENLNSLTFVENVEIRVSFFDDTNPNPIDVVKENTTLYVIPPNGQSPFAIRSSSPNPEITQASVSLLGFDSAVPKQKGLVVYSSDVLLDSSFKFSGVLQNIEAPNSDTNVYLAFYDSFEPPRILAVSTIELGDVESNATIPFNLDVKIDSRSVGFFLFADSNIFYSDFVDVKIPTPQSLTKLASISNVVVKDTLGMPLSEIKLGSIVNIESQIDVEFIEEQVTNETPYSYYIQIKNSKTSVVEHIEKYDGRFIGDGSQSQTIDWLPGKSGLFFIETFVWDRNNIPLSEQGPFVLIYVK